MFSRHSFQCGLLAVLALCLQPCKAQNAADISLKFVSFPKSAEEIKVKLALGEGKTIDITAHSNWVSDPIRVPVREIWAIGEMATGPEGKTIFKEFGRAKSLASTSQLIVLVRKGKDNADGFDVIPLDAQDTGFSKGSFLFMNAARVDIGGILGDKKFTVKPGGHAIIKPVGVSDERMMKAVFYYRRGDETKPFFSSRWPISADARGLVFFYHVPDSDQLRFHTIRDFP
jgi:hypothetical protein